MAVNIVTPFASGDDYAGSVARAITLADAWLGDSSTAAVATWEDYHDLINPVLTAFGATNIANGNTGQQWLDRMNALNDAQALMASVAKHWWTADRADLITLSGSQVTAFNDVYTGASMVQAVSSARPIYSATSFGGAPGLTFDGTDDELTMTGVGNMPTGAAASNLVVVGQQDSLVADTSTRSLFSYGGIGAVNSRRVMRTVVSGVNRARALTGDGAAGQSTTNTLVDFSSRHVVRGIFDATQTNINVDSQEDPTPTSVVPSTSTTRARLGAGTANAADAFLQGKIRDAAVFGALTTDQGTYVVNFFKSRRAL